MGMSWNMSFLEQPTVPVSGESRYLTPLCVSANEEPREEVKYKIRAALTRLSFREQHVLVQFWSPRSVGKHQLLTTIDQPFGVGVANDALCIYRKDSEHNVFLVDKDHEEEDISPPARVFRRGMPEWTSNLNNYNNKDFPQLDCAIHCNLHGYLAIPVFDPTTWKCVGVLELLTSVNYTSYAFEVQQVCKALKAERLLSPVVFDSPIPKVLNERKQNVSDKIFNILKTVCDTYSLPLAQTWTVSPSSSFVSNNKVIEKTCSSFDTRCIGKVCMSTTAQPFHMRNLHMWGFRKACREQHLDKYSAFVGKVLLAHGSCYIQNVTELSEEEYPLVHIARMSGLTGCFTIFLHSLEGDGDGDGDDDYVLEFFVPLDNNNSRLVQNLVQTLKQIASGFELGEVSPLEVTEPLRDVSFESLSISPCTVQKSSTTTVNTLMDSSDSESVFANGAKTDSAIVPSQRSMKQNQPNTSTDAVKKNNRSKQTRKRKIDLLTMEALKQHVEKPLDQTAQIFGVSRSTLKRFCRKHGISSWPPVPKNLKRSIFVFDPKLSQKLWSEKYLQRSSSPSFGSAISAVIYVVIRVKRWSCSSKKHGFLGKWWSCGKHSYLPFHGSSLVDASSSRIVGHVSDTGSLMVKARFKDDMVKFRFLVSSGFSGLEKEVVQRLNNVKDKRFCLKYKDEDDDLVLITCDADLKFMASNTTIRLVVEADD